MPILNLIPDTEPMSKGKWTIFTIQLSSQPEHESVLFYNDTNNTY